MILYKRVHAMHLSAQRNQIHARKNSDPNHPEPSSHELRYLKAKQPEIKRTVCIAWSPLKVLEQDTFSSPKYL